MWLLAAHACVEPTVLDGFGFLFSPGPVRSCVFLLESGRENPTFG